jgi:hypothetical protein
VILVKRRDATRFDCIAGAERLRAALAVFGKATVTDAESKEEFEVHEVEGDVVFLQKPGQAIAETLADSAITKAAGSSSGV